MGAFYCGNKHKNIAEEQIIKKIERINILELGREAKNEAGHFVSSIEDIDVIMIELKILMKGNNCDHSREGRGKSH